jgi:hypothetical protein
MDILDWLLQEADPALRYQVSRDLLDGPEAHVKEIQQGIGSSGYGKLLLDRRNADGHWGNGAYNPKWTCTHYVLFELLQLGLSSANKQCRESALLLLDNPVGRDGGINYAKTIEYSDVCVNGMLLSVASYFDCGPENVTPLIEYLLKVQMRDGGWNCEYIHDAVHSSLHTTISVLEGLTRYLSAGYANETERIRKAIARGIEFILRHKLYKSETTGEMIKDEFFKYTFPIRWKYDILRCLDYFRAALIPYDERMEDALALIINSRTRDGKWKAFSQPGKTYFIMEKNGAPGKWNTMRALRVLKYYGR